MAKFNMDSAAADLAKINALIGNLTPTLGALLGLARLGYDVLRRQQAGQQAASLQANLKVVREGSAQMIDRADEWDLDNPPTA